MQSGSDATPLALAGQALAVFAVLGLVLAWFAAAPASPYSAVPEVILARKVTVALFWKARTQGQSLSLSFSRPGCNPGSFPPQVADNLYNPLHLACVLLLNALLAVLAFVLPVVQTLPEAVMLAVTELGGLLLDVALVLAAAAKAVALKLVYVAVLSLDSLVAFLAFVCTDAAGAVRYAAEWLWAKDLGGLVLSLLLARPFTAPAQLLLHATKLAIQYTMWAVELACAVAYATPAALGVALIPAAYIAHAVWKRARRVVVAEPPLSFTLEELDAKVAQLQPLRVPELPVLEKMVENEYMSFVNAVGTLQPLRVPPLPVDELRAANAAANVQAVTRAQAVDAVIDRAPMDTTYSISSSTVVTQQVPTEAYDGLTAVRASVDAFDLAVAALPPLADPSRAAAAADQAAVAAAALSAAEAALAEAEAAFYAIDAPITATTTTVTSMTQAGVPVGSALKRLVDETATFATTPLQTPPPAAAPPARAAPAQQQPAGDQGNGPDRSSSLKEALIRGVAASLGVAAAVERAAGGTQVRKAADQDDKKA